MLTITEVFFIFISVSADCSGKRLFISALSAAAKNAININPPNGMSTAGYITGILMFTPHIVDEPIISRRAPTGIMTAA